MSDQTSGWMKAVAVALDREPTTVVMDRTAYVSMRGAETIHLFRNVPGAHPRVMEHQRKTYARELVKALGVSGIGRFSLRSIFDTSNLDRFLEPVRKKQGRWAVFKIRLRVIKLRLKAWWRNR